MNNVLSEVPIHDPALYHADDARIELKRDGEVLVFDIFWDEAGVDAPNAERYDTSGGDDGESFVIPMIQGRADRYTYRFELETLQPRTNWGNQHGLRRVDITSMKGISIFFHGGQGNNQIGVYALKLVR